MARQFVFLNIFFILIATTTSLAEHTFVLPVLKDTKTGLYYTNVTVGEPPLVVNLAVDVRGSALWFQCQEIGYNSTTYTPILCESPRCNQIGGRCTTCYGAPYGPSCRDDSCDTNFYYSAIASLIEDNAILSYTSPSTYVAQKLAARVPLACLTGASAVLAGLPFGSQGILGLGNSSTSFVNGLVSSYKTPFYVALCLPSKPGINESGYVHVGGGPYLLPASRKDVSGLLVSTPLDRKRKQDGEDDYFIDVKSIQVNGETVSINQNLLTFNKTSESGGTTINTMIPYTYLDSSIYNAVLKAFAGNAKKRKAVAPFTDCFSYKSFGGKSYLEKETPVITLVLVGGVKWNIYGPNSLVKVKKTVVCLGFMDVGYNPTISIEIGGYQMQDNLVEFDLEASKFSFTSSLLVHNASCSQL